MAAHTQEGLTLSEFIWNQSSDLLEEARNTLFIRGVRDGELDPNFYGIYMLQDGLWCLEVSKIWKEVSRSNREGIDDQIRQFARESASKYRKGAENIYQGWNISQIRAGSEAQDYVHFIRAAFKEYAPSVLIATYACVKLWLTLTNELENVVKEGNPYKVWVDTMKSSGRTAEKQAQLIDTHKGFDRHAALSMFRMAMQKEIMFFNRGGDSQHC
ncbi:hypothetical protein KP509_26G002700 [Ceratopteris richardii]|uniref:Thiaminase-2/PQQC domain-containing protein n=1 Tax=Ceratopteris richardii TaxID=49495 RepID=A0A8T2RKC8_CERRI|nr:hypothetical protein KP509_26G002700 [Ceratopteris richardii]